MAKEPGVDAIYEVAELWASECLFKDDSLLWPGTPVWTLENLEILQEAYLENPDTGEGDFISKWEKQLQDVPDSAYGVMVEIAVIYSLFPHASGWKPASKLAFIDQVRNLRPRLAEPNTDRWDLVVQATSGNGIAKMGMDYIIGKYFHVGMYLATALEVKRRNVASLQQMLDENIVDDALAWVSLTMNYRPRSTRNVLMNLFCPDKYEPTASDMHKSRMAKNLSAKWGLTPLDDDDETILQARRHMEKQQTFPKGFSMYSAEVRPLWDFKPGSPPDPVNSFPWPEEARAVYDLAAIFRQRVIEEGRSFLWPGRIIWTPENAAALREAEWDFVSSGHLGGLEHLIPWIESQALDVQMLAADIQALVHIVWSAESTSPEVSASISSFLQPIGIDPSEIELYQALVDLAGSRRPGSSDWLEKTFISHHMNSTRVISYLVSDTTRDIDTEYLSRLIDKAYDLPQWDRIWWHARGHEVLHVLYPGLFTSVRGTTNRKKIISRYGRDAKADPFLSEQGQVMQIQRYLSPRWNGDYFDFYSEPFLSEWKQTKLPAKSSRKFDLAAQFRERVLENNGSFLWPDAEQVWTVENVRSALEAISPLAGMKQDEAQAHEKGILSTADPNVFKVLRDLRAISIVRRYMTHVSAQALMDKVVDEDHHFDGDSLLLQEVIDSSREPFPGRSNGTAGDPFIDQMIVVLEGILSILEHPDDIGDRDPMADHVLATSSETRFLWPFWCLYYLMYPEQVAPVPGYFARERIFTACRQLTEGKEYPNYMAKLADIREQLEPDFDPYRFDFFAEPWRSKWDSKHTVESEQSDETKDDDLEPSSSPDRVNSFPWPEEARAVYDLAAIFRQRVFEEGRSFLWPDRFIWTPENASALREIELSFEKDGSPGGLNALATILAEKSNDLCMMAADAEAAMYSNWSVSPHTIRQNVEIFSRQRNMPEADHETWQRLETQSTYRIPASFTFSKGGFVQRHMSVVLAICALVTNKTSIDGTETLVKLVKEALKGTQPLQTFSWTLLHSLYPAEISSVSSQDDRSRIIKHYGDAAGVDSSISEHGQVMQIQRFLADRWDGAYFDFYGEVFLQEWDPGSKRNSGGRYGPPIGPDDPGSDSPIVTPPTITDLAAATYLDEDYLCGIESLLSTKKQLIFEGPPGSGKTFVADKFARYFTEQSLSGEANEQLELVQFHQSYSYEDFIEGIRPETNDDGHLVYQVRKGIFREFADRADANPDKRFVLIIDEINRGNLSRILGELMLLLEYRDKSATLPYSKEPLRIPPNLYIIGTMNSADRSLSQIDYALRRRFYFVPFMSVIGDEAPVLARWFQAQGVADHQRVLRLFITLNHRLSNALGTDDLQIGHSYFMETAITTDGALERVWKYAVTPLLREYLYHHRDKDHLLGEFDIARLEGQNAEVAALSNQESNTTPESADDV